MNYQELKRAKETFPIHRYEKKYKEIEAVRLAFVHRFSKQALADMMVYDIITKNPKIWNMGNPFKKNGVLKLQPIKYRVEVKTTKK